ncbi:MAG: MlaD family protein [Candidatus Dormibacteraeota bacterium]|nr:MlaD family protein [Candidatus Dormibacteraeota bacterium]
MKRAIRTHATDFAAILVLLLLSVVVAGYILNHERFRFPFIQSSPFTLNAEFQTAQAVTPGQGQSVRVSGVQIGEIGGITLRNGKAVVQMQIDEKYKHLIHTNATALLRPKTGLKDMFIELNPGAGPAPVAKPNWTLPVGNTNPDVNVDEILSSLDGDTRSYLNLLVNGAGQGLKGQGGSELAQVFQRFEPTHRDLARVNQAVAVRGTDLRQLVNSLQRLNTALATKQGEIVSLVDSSSKVFRAFASENGNISRALVDLPGTLSQTTTTLQKVTAFARLLGPTSINLLPAARSLPAANAALVALAKPSTPIIRNQIRPFVIAARPLVRSLKPASINLAKSTPNVTGTFHVLNRLFNMLGYYPTGTGQHGYLWWLAWLDHEARTLFSVQDANGDYRPLFLQASCAALSQISQGISGSSLVLNLTPILQNAQLCPSTASSGGGLPGGLPGGLARHGSTATPNPTTKP